MTFTIKDDVYERKIQQKAISIFGRFMMRPGCEVKNEVADLLDEAFDANQISQDELGQVLATDLLWQGKLRNHQVEVILVVEASWLAEVGDVERAVARAATLRKIGLAALPVVSGRDWSPEAIEQAAAQGVVQVVDIKVEADSWVAAANRLMV